MLKIIISPAKKMNIAEEAPAVAGVPCFLNKTEVVKQYLKKQDYDTLKEIWKCNDKLAQLNAERVKDMDLKRQVTPAVFAYEGIQYQSMAPMVMEQSQLDYIEKHLYILSGFYGILRAFDGVVPYRLEMQARIQMETDGKIVTSLYDFWGEQLYQVLAGEEDAVSVNAGDGNKTRDIDGGNVVIVNLASREYAKAVLPWVSGRVKVVECVFGEMENQRVRVTATAAKMARGAMVRYMAENQVESVEELKGFRLMGYEYREELSDEKTLVFVQEPMKKYGIDG
ncbi:MAG: YaaA family protein [Clostridium sp.]|nr:YaaA family protein [Clostridium sp.]